MELLLGLGLLLFSGTLYGRNSEKKAYNNGICPNCGNKLEYFDTDSQDGRGYMCPSCKYTTWCSYSVDK